MGYVVVEPGGRVGSVGRARLVPRDAPEEALRYARLAEYYGMAYVYLEAGSGASEPVPVEMIRTVKEGCGLPLIVGGGIRDAASAKAVVEAGADVFVTGNLIEEEIDVQKALGRILRESLAHLRRRFRRPG
jgi:phosphoglycerol geranylgeranyltransferase